MISRFRMLLPFALDGFGLLAIEVLTLFGGTAIFAFWLAIVVPVFVSRAQTPSEQAYMNNAQIEDLSVQMRDMQKDISGLRERVRATETNIEDLLWLERCIGGGVIMILLAAAFYGRDVKKRGGPEQK